MQRRNEQCTTLRLEQLARRLTLYAHRRLQRFGCADPRLAEDLAMDAIERCIRSGELTATTDSSQFLALCSVVNGVAINEARKRRRRREVEADPDDGTAVVSEVDPERRTASAQQLSVVVRAVRERFAGDTAVLGVLGAVLDGVDKPFQQAAHANISIEELRNAIRRLRGFLRQRPDWALLSPVSGDHG